MVIILILTGLAITLLSIFFKLFKRSKLSQIDLTEYNQTIHPQITKYYLLVNVPVILVFIFVFTGLTMDIIVLSALFALIQIGFYVYCYVQVKKIINVSNNPDAHNFTAVCLIVDGIGRLIMISALLYLFLMPGPY